MALSSLSEERKAATNSRQHFTHEEIFFQRISEMKLWANFQTEYRENYGAKQVRFWITIHRGRVCLERTSSGFCSTLDEGYREVAFEQANRRLNTIEMYKHYQEDSRFKPKPHARNYDGTNGGKYFDRRNKYHDQRNC